MLSGMNSVISDWLGTQIQSCSSRSRKVGLRSSLPFGQGVEIFSAIRMREKYYSLADCLDGLCSAGYNQSGDGRGTCLLLLQSHPARRRGYGLAGRTCSVQVGRIEEVKLHYHEYCPSSFPIQSTRVLWLPLPQQHSVSFHAWLTYSICSEAGHLPCPHKQ